MSPRPLTCAHCDKPLSALQRQQGRDCGDAGCRHREAQARLQRLDATLGAAARSEATARLGRAPTALLWLRASPTRQVPVAAARRSAHQAFLQSLIDTAAPGPDRPLPEPPADVAPAGPQEGHLCAHCRGRCCGEGGRQHAFITLPQLLRWQGREPGRTLQAAVDFFMARLPQRHTRGSCLYHGAQGCALSREDRAEICNSFACDALQQTRGVLREAPDAAFAVVMLKDDQPLRRVAIAADGTAPLRARTAKR